MSKGTARSQNFRRARGGNRRGTATETLPFTAWCNAQNGVVASVVFGEDGGRWSARDTKSGTSGARAWSRLKALRPQSVLACLTFAWLALSVLGFGWYIDRFYPLREWLTFFWLRAWALTILFAVSSLAVGLQALLVLRTEDEVPVKLTLAFALGVLIQGLGIYVGGVLGLLGLPFFGLWPALLLALGRRPLVRAARGVLQRASGLEAMLVPRTFGQAVAAIAVIGGATALYLQVITPSNIGFDARWYHLPIAERYAAAGRIRPFPEGWYPGAYPQLASILYTWAFLAPGELADRLALATHLEFLLLLATVTGISALAAQLIGGDRPRYGGAALFLFPGIFIYDSNLNAGADHVLAFWGAPLGLALLRYMEQGTPRQGAILGSLLAAAALTKYQAIYFIVPCAAVLLIELARRRRLAPFIATIGAALVLSSPHWLKNWIAHGDPLYPNLYAHLSARPFFPGAEDFLKRGYWLRGSQPLVAKVKELPWALFQFSFVPHGWAETLGGRPNFGSLFTLLLPLMLWVRPRTRVVTLVACVHLGLAVWFLTYAYDRYLQALLPWMAACTAATLAALWRIGPIAVRFAVVVLLGLQLTWSADTYFVSASRLKELIDHLAAGDAKVFARKPYPGQELVPIGARLGKQPSSVVAHDFYQSLGVGAVTICDNPHWQGAVEYLQLDTPERVRKTWAQLGATHVLFPVQKEARAPDDLARDAVFGRAAVAFTKEPWDVAGYRVASLIRSRRLPEHRDPTRIAWLACSKDRRPGIYTPRGLARGDHPVPLSREQLARDATGALADANAIWYRADCPEAVAAARVLEGETRLVLRSGDLSLHVRPF